MLGVTKTNMDVVHGEKYLKKERYQLMILWIVTY